MFGSDWPWGKQNAPVKVVEKACDGDKELEAKVFYKKRRKTDCKNRKRGKVNEKESERAWNKI